MSILGIIASSMKGAPSSPVAGYYVWLDAADTSTITAAGGLVSQWTDKSANAFAFTQSTTAYKPDTGVDTQNGKNVLSWDSNDLLLSTAASSTWKFLHYATSTIFVAFKETDNNASAGILTTNGGSTSNVGFYIFHQATSKLQTINTFGTTSNFVINNNTANNALDTNFTYITVIGDPQNGTAANRSDIRIKQGSAIKNNSANNAAANLSPTNTLHIGDYIAGGASALTGTLGEIIIYNSILSAGDILLNQQYLAAKWGV